MSHRRTFLKQIGLATAATAVGAGAGTVAATEGTSKGLDIDAGGSSKFDYPWQFNEPPARRTGRGSDAPERRKCC